MELMALPVLQLMVLLVFALAAIALVVWIIGKIMDALSAPQQGPTHKLIGQLGRVTAAVSRQSGGKVVVAGEIWDAQIAPAFVGAEDLILNPDQRVQVMGFDPQDERIIQVVPL